MGLAQPGEFFFKIKYYKNSKYQVLTYRMIRKKSKKLEILAKSLLVVYKSNYKMHVEPKWYISLMVLIVVLLSQNFLLFVQVMGSKTKIFIILEFVTGGELFDRIVSFEISVLLPPLFIWTEVVSLCSVSSDLWAHPRLQNKLYHAIICLWY